MSPLLAQSGQIETSAVCPLSGVKRTLLGERVMSAPDPKRTWSALKARIAAASCRHDWHARANQWQEITKQLSFPQLTIFRESGRLGDSARAARARRRGSS